jgi:D-alanine--poly(phosphoribitol) ligase subunit 1
MAGTNIFLIDEAGRPVESSESGEIVICGPNVSPGYLGRPDLTEQAFFTYDGRQAYRTGDCGHFQEGMLFFEGRNDNRIKLHGYRIELGDVEANLQALPEIRDAVVIPVMKRGQPDSLAAFVILREPQRGTDSEVARMLREGLAERVPSYMLPRKFRFLDAFPMTMNGKVDRRRLAESLT